MDQFIDNYVPHWKCCRFCKPDFFSQITIILILAIISLVLFGLIIFVSLQFFHACQISHFVSDKCTGGLVLGENLEHLSSQCMGSKEGLECSALPLPALCLWTGAQHIIHHWIKGCVAPCVEAAMFYAWWTWWGQTHGGRGGKKEAMAVGLRPG